MDRCGPTFSQRDVQVRRLAVSVSDRHARITDALRLLPEDADILEVCWRALDAETF